MPRNQQSEMPQNQQPGMPRNQQSDGPRNQQSDGPRNQQSGMPRNQQSGMPRNQQSGMPRNQQSGMPRNQQSGMPQYQQRNNDRNGGDRRDRREQSRRDGSYAQTPMHNYPPPLLPEHRMPQYNVAPPVIQPVIYQPMMPPHMSMQQGPILPPYYHQPIGTNSPPYTEPPPPYHSMNIGNSNFQDKPNEQHFRNQSDRGGQRGRPPYKGRVDHGSNNRMERASRSPNISNDDTVYDVADRSLPSERSKWGRGGHCGRGGCGNANRTERVSSSRRSNSDDSVDDAADRRLPNERNNRGRGGQNERSHNRGRGGRGNANRMERASSTLSINSEGTEDDAADRRLLNERNNRGRGGQSGRPHHRGRDGHGNTNRMERASSTLSINSEGTEDDAADRRLQNERNNRGRGGQSGRPHHRGRDGHGNANRMERASSTLSINSEGTEDAAAAADRRLPNERNFRGRGGRGGRPHQRGRGGHGNANRMERASSTMSISSEGTEDGNADRRLPNERNYRGRGGRGGRPHYRGRGGNGNANRMERASSSLSSVNFAEDAVDRNNWRRCEIERNNRRRLRHVRPSYRGREGNVGRASSSLNFNKRNFYQKHNPNEVVNKGREQRYSSQLLSGKDDPSYSQKDLYNSREMNRNKFNKQDSFKHLKNVSKQSFHGGWTFLTRNNASINSEVSDLDDSLSLTSEVSVFDEENDEINTDRDSNNIEDIKIDDIFTVSLTTLKNRVKRHKRKLTSMKKKGVDKNTVQTYESRLKLVQDAKEKRMKELGESITDEVNDAVDAVKNKNSNRAIKKLHVVKSVKGCVSFQPKRNKKLKSRGTNNPKLSKNTGHDDTGIVSDYSDGTEIASDDSCEWENETSYIPNELGSKKKQGTGSYKLSVDNQKENVKESINKNKNLNRILSKLDNIISDEKLDKSYTKDPSSESFDDENVSTFVDKSSKSQKKKAKKIRNDVKQSYAEDKPVSRAVADDCKSFKGNDNKAGKEHKINEGASPDANEVFKFIVKTLDGKGTPEEIVRESDLFPLHFDSTKWFKKLERRFTVIERNGCIELVLVSCKEASYCLDYVKNKSCTNPKCARYHVCKDMLAGFCLYGPEKCKFSHDLLDGRNMKISKDLGFSNVFTNEEICSILKVRYPHLCTSWKEDGICSEVGCYALHICPRFIYGKCLEGDNCTLNHDKTSEHNQPIIDAYKMSKWNDGLFKKMIYVMRNATTDDSIRESVEVCEDQNEGFLADDQRKQKKRKQKISVSENLDIAGDSQICSQNLVGTCKQHCKYIHSSLKLPYIWQISLSGTWVTVDETEDIEKSFSGMCDHSDMFQMIHEDMEFGARIFFKPYIRAVTNLAQPGSDKSPVEARRLSTVSFAQSATENDFQTQWRWYWQDNDYQWQLYEPDTMQHTLENKFLAKQSCYNYSRENYRFKYTICFDTMMQTNLEYGTKRVILRRPLFVSSDDVKSGHFPAFLSVAPEIRVDLPDSWVPWDLVNPFELVTLHEKDPSYKLVCEHFYKTLDPSQQKITDIFRVQNHKLWKLFKNQEEYMQSNYQRVGKNISVDKRLLFHGTTNYDAVRDISINNFDMRVSGTHGTVYGDGAYFARDAKYSHNYTQPPKRLMFLASVLVGQFTEGNKSIRRPPQLPGSQHELYDSCVNSVDNPKIFVVFDKNQYYPDYLIQYQDLTDSASSATYSSPLPSQAAQNRTNVSSFSSATHSPPIPSQAAQNRTNVSSFSSATHSPPIPSQAAQNRTRMSSSSSDPTSAVNQTVRATSSTGTVPSTSSNIRIQSPRSESAQHTSRPSTQPQKKDEGCCMQ